MITATGPKRRRRARPTTRIIDEFVFEADTPPTPKELAAIHGRGSDWTFEVKEMRPIKATTGAELIARLTGKANG